MGVSREEKIKKIYEVVATKSISYRCNNCDREYTEEGDCKQCARDMSISCKEVVSYEPVMIGDVLDWIELHRENRIDDMIFDGWEQKRKPIESQSDSLIDFVYGLTLLSE